MESRIHAQELTQATERFLRYGDECAAWVNYEGQVYVIRFLASNMKEALSTATWLVGEDGWSWYLAAVMCRTIRRGLME